MFYVGNVLPDLMVGGRLRARHLADAPSGDVSRGAALHLATDRRFHAAPAFHEAMVDASALLRAALAIKEGDEDAPPRRVFFLAHVFVELALDAVLLRDDTGLADHFYAQFTAVSPGTVAAAAESLLGHSLPELAPALARFTATRYLYDYARDDGLAEGLHRISRRVGLTGFPAEAERARVAAAFAAFLQGARRYGASLWQPPLPGPAAAP